MNWLNATFEVIGALLAWRSVVELQKVGAPSGVYWPQFAFGTLWAAECVPYYLAHGDVASAVCATYRCLGLAVWTWLTVRR